MRKFATFLSLVLLASLLNACGAKDENAANSKNDTRATLVTVTKVKKQTIEVTQSTVGTLEGLINPTLAAETAARVIGVHVNIGDTVQRGQLIATLDATDFTMQRNEAQAEVARIQALLNNQ